LSISKHSYPALETMSWTIPRRATHRPGGRLRPSAALRVRGIKCVRAFVGRRACS